MAGESIELRLTPAEHARIADAAEAAGEDVEGFVRRAVELRREIAKLPREARRLLNSILEDERYVASKRAAGISERNARESLAQQRARDARPAAPPSPTEQILANRRAAVPPLSAVTAHPNHPVAVSRKRAASRRAFRGASKRREPT